MLTGMELTALWLFVLTLGIACGAGFYEHRIVLPRWLSGESDRHLHWNAAAARADDVGRRFWAGVTTLPLTLLTLLNAVAAASAHGSLRVWWLTAVVAAVADRLLTFSYFIPTMIRLMRAEDSHEAVAIATRWSRLNHLRHAVIGVAWVTAMQALTLLSVAAPA
jgi:hypothetical protein